ncbi:MAG: diphosphate--fructose-6-phosphate 1-phosphotransferase [Treponema sp.]|jgi:pyrophosphate--fructose-6-phosphate 1-phosphotransferase|nr:diphosphate--fructose-6-phosphate 1-phosphotransferase [Treponema sp.]
MEISSLQRARYAYNPKLPAILREELGNIALKLGESAEAMSDQGNLRLFFRNTYGKPIAVFEKGKNLNVGKKLNVGVILSGGQAPGGHNVIAGLFDGLKKGNAESQLFGFLGGPSGLIENKYTILTIETIDQYRNTGGFDIIGSGRTKIETSDQFKASLQTARALELNAVVIIGGDDSNTNAALLAEYFVENDCPIQVIGCPKTIDGDLKNEYIETSFGFDTAVKTYSELIGNIERDANSAKKYWHFIKLMGRSASHIALECALQTQPNICFISEEVEAKQTSLSQVVDIIVDAVVKRANEGDNFGVILIPEGLIEFIPEMKKLIEELNDTMGVYGREFEKLDSFIERLYFLDSYISEASYNLLKNLPSQIAEQLLLDRDPHGNVQVSRIDTEKLLINMVEKQLAKLKDQGVYKGKFATYGHFFGYEGRCAAPSNFDADYCYSLGFTAFMLIAAGFTGYISSVRNLTAPVEQWIAGGVPLTMMMNMEQRHGIKKPVIKKALVSLDGAPFKTFAAKRGHWAVNTCYLFPGAIQYFGPPEVCDQPTKTLILEKISTSN